MLYLTGEPRILEADKAIALPERISQLMMLLVGSPKFRISRSKAARLLWDGLNERRNLRQLISRIKSGHPLINKNIEISAYEIILLNTNVCDISRLLDISLPLDPLSVVIDFSDDPFSVCPPTYEFSEFLNDLKKKIIFTQESKIRKEIVSIEGSVSPDFDYLEKLALALVETLPPDKDNYEIARRISSKSNKLLTTRKLNILINEKSNNFNNEEIYLPGTLPALKAVTDKYTPVSTHLPCLALLDLGAGSLDNGSKKSVGILPGFIKDLADILSCCDNFQTLSPHYSFKLNHDGGVVFDFPTTTGFIPRVDYSLLGVVYISGTDVVWNLRLVDCASGVILWANEFLLEKRCIIETRSLLMRSLLMQISNRINTEILNNALSQAKDTEAYINYIHGRQIEARHDLAKLRRARKLYSRSLAIDSTMSFTRARLAGTLVDEWLLLLNRDNSLLTQAAEQAETALSLNNGEPMAYWSLGLVALYSRRTKEAVNHLKDAEALAPYNTEIILDTADALSHAGDFYQALMRISRTIKLDPDPNDNFWWKAASIAHSAGEFSVARDYLAKIKDDDLAVPMRASVHAMLGLQEEAEFYLRRAKLIFPGLSMAKVRAAIPEFIHPDGNPPYFEGLRRAGLI